MIVFAIGIDQLTKQHFHSPGLFVPNYGISFGNLSEANPIVRIILASTFFGLLSMLYLGVVMFLWTARELFLVRLGLTLFYAGVAGNGIDRIRLGYVVDFIEMGSAVLNVADIIQLGGLVLTIFSLFYLNQKLWRLNNLRSISIINPKFQFSFAFKLVLVGACSQILAATFGHSLLVAVLPISPLRDESIRIFDYGMLGILLVQSVVLFLFGLLLGHRISGPIYALSKFVADLREGKPREFKLRSNDYHPEIEAIADEIQKLRGT